MSYEHDASERYHSQRSADDDNENESEVENYGPKSNTRRVAECDANELGASHGEMMANDEVDHDDGDSDENYDADDDNDLVTQSSSLTEDNIVSDKRIKDVKLATKDTTFSLADITGFDNEVKSQTIETTAVNNGKERPSGARAKTSFTSNEYTAKVPTTSYPPNLGPKILSPGLPRVNGAELNYFYNSRIPSLDATGINQNFPARHTTDGRVDGIHGKFIRDSNFDDEDKNDVAADDDNYIVTKSSSLPVDSIVPGKSIKDIKLATNETNVSLPVNTKSRTIVITAGDNNGNKKPPGATAKTLLTSNEYTAKVPTASYPPSLKPKTSSPSLPRGNWLKLDYLSKSRIPSLEATGINQKFLARHTTDQSLQHASQPGDFKLTRELTPPTNWPEWSLPPPPMTETNNLRPTAKSHTLVVCRKATATVTELQPSASVTSQSVPPEFNGNSNFDYENKNDDDESEDVVAKSSSLPVESLVPRKSFKDFKLATKDTKLSLPLNAGLDDQVKSRTIGTIAGDNNGNKKPSGAKTKTWLTSNEYTAKIPTMSYPPSLGSKTSSLRLPRVNGAELNYFNSRIPSLDATGINQNFLARHTTDQSLQYASQPSDFKLTRELTSRTDWPVWSLPPPPMTETNNLRHRWPQSSVLHPSVVGYQTGGQSNWNDEPPALRLPTAKSHTLVVCRKATATVTELQPSASVTSQSVPSYSYQSSVLPEKRQERFLEPSIPNSFTENQEHVHPVTSPEISSLRGEDQRNGAVALSPEFPDDSSLAALERKVAEACAVVERVMKEREERTKAQREAARKKREMREQRERETREMREREERERREREERERKEREEREREDRKMRERQEREIRERNERDRSEQIENEDRDTRWFGGERAPVQESPRWQCEHYQRRCLVKFPCCGIFYPCHRCHNTSGACDTDDRKANNATHVKCGICGHEEEVSGFVLTVIPNNCFAHSYCA